VERQAQIRGVDRCGQAQRIEAGVQVAARTVGGDQTTDIALALVACTVAGTGLQRILGRVRNVEMTAECGMSPASRPLKPSK
jgi:hypothetical protein